MTLHPQSQEFLDSIAAANRPAWSELPPNTSRKMFGELTRSLGKGPEIQRVRDVTSDEGVAMRIYQTDTSRAQPVTMYFHGGGWVLGDLETHDSLCRQLAQKADCAVVAVDYRRSPEHRYPVALDDCYSATKWIAQRSDEFGLDGTRLIVAGDSVGGNLSATVALKARDVSGPKLLAQVLIYPVIARVFDTESYTQYAEGYGLTREVMRWFWDQYLGTDEPDTYAMPSLAGSLEGLPPAHVVTAQYDVLCTEGEEYAAMLQRAGVATSVRRYDGMLHGFVHYATIFDVGRQAITDLGEVLRAFFASAQA